MACLVPAPAMSTARAAHTATVLPDGRVLVAGGFVENGSARGAEIYDAGAGRCAPLPPMIVTRHSHSATLLPDGRVLLAGGYGEGSTTLATAEVFDPATNSFAATGSLLAARSGHVAVLLENGSASSPRNRLRLRSNTSSTPDPIRRRLIQER